ncbi:glycoside hydrolase family 73 protein [uncultured Limosilactobacillus sp.]|uniref:glycoside hydrolase family 73 protein n=1 Tax=uncultured Limosilactobacillus sp. TaxID=2837629 RepID=UPI0025E673CF|nr:glycoside hydrolase family 73 protein [uncultured Limosilactobacillus sp.]
MKARILVTTLVITQLIGLVPMKSVNAVESTEEQRYWSGYRVGRNDARQHCQRQWQDPFILAGYQRGLKEQQEEDRQQESAVPKEQPAPPAAPAASVVDEERPPADKALPMSVSQRQFVNHLAPAAQQLGSQYDLFPSVLLAQAALESNWGQSDLALGHHNLFGIKALPHQRAVTLPTTEDSGSGMVKTTAAFCHYASDAEALAAYAQLLQSPLYAGVHRQQAHNYQAATRALTGVFATDHLYHQKLNYLIEAYQLDRYDRPATAENQQEKDQQPPVPAANEKKPAAAARQKPAESIETNNVGATKKMAWYWWPVSIISGGSLTWLVDFWRHRVR